jgi:hypothetical protein
MSGDLIGIGVRKGSAQPTLDSCLVAVGHGCRLELFSLQGRLEGSSPRRDEVLSASNVLLVSRTMRVRLLLDHSCQIDMLSTVGLLGVDGPDES